ncbi:MAG: molybdopterin cofactor-binding domain-containing protein [Pseudomonadota bacterium]
MQRREFLKFSAGGLTLALITPGLTVARVANPNDAALESSDGVLSIRADGRVVFVSPYTEMGQGTPTSAAQILADAMHTDLDRLEIVHPEGTQAQRDPSYRDRFNGGGSGGSQSMATAWPALTAIGATARTLLMTAAAREAGVALAETSTRTDLVLAGGREFSYGDLADAAATLPIPATPLYRPVSEYRYVGKGRARSDLGQIVSGSAPYAMDAAMDGMLYAGLERCPTCGGSPDIRNREDVLAIEGVLDVFALDSKRVTPDAKPAVVVVGRDTWSVLRGRRALDVRWKPADSGYPNDEAFWDAMANGLRAIEPNTIQESDSYSTVDLSDSTELTAEYRTPYQNQAIMEPMAMVAHRRENELKIILSTQYPGSARDKIAELTGLSQEQISVENRIMGGSFGRRSVPDCLTETVLIAERVKKPVKVMWTREDDTRHGQYRTACLSRITASVDDDGGIRRWEHAAIQTHPTDPSAIRTLEYGMNDSPYRLDAARYTIAGIDGDVNRGPMRSPPHPLKTFAVTSFIDEIAHENGRDPIDLHIELIGEPRDIPLADWLTNHGHVDNTGRHVDVANMVRKLSQWDEPLPAGYGRGFSSGFIFGTHIAMVVTVRYASERIHIERADCAVHCGRVINPDIARQQVEGGLIYGLSSAMGEVISTEHGAVTQGNFHDYPIMRIDQAPSINVVFADSDERPSGLGEPPTPPAYAALANAIFAASGRRIREIPLNRHIRFA